MNFPEKLKYTTEHEWISIDGNVATVGVTDHAQGELGDVVYIDMEDEIGQVSRGDSFGTIEAVKTVSDIYAPLTGKVIEVNAALNDNPEIVNSDPYGDGWFVKIEFSNSSELDDLLDVNAYKELIGQ